MIYLLYLETETPIFEVVLHEIAPGGAWLPPESSLSTERDL